MRPSIDHKPRVLIIDSSIDVTGALKAIVLFASSQSNNFDFYFLIPKGSKGRMIIERSGILNIYELPLRELSKNIWSIISYLPALLVNANKLRRIIRDVGIELVHVNDIYNLLQAVNRVLGDRTPYICHVRFLPDRFPRLLFALWYRLHDRLSFKLVAVSKSLADKLPKSKKVIQIYDPPPTENLGSEFSQTNRDFTFLYLANYIDGKGHKYALRAFATIHGEYPDWRLRFVGSDMGLQKNVKYKEELVKVAMDLGLSDNIDWMGFTSNTEQEYKSAAVVLNFSESESFSMTCMEALYFGRPLIATDSGGPSEMMADGIGILVANRDLRAMTEAMKWMINNPTARHKMAVRARETMKARFSMDETVWRLTKTYFQALEA